MSRLTSLQSAWLLDELNCAICMQRRRLIAGLAVGTGLLLGGLYYWSSVREITVQTVPVERNVEVRVFGTVEAQVLSKVGFQVSGKIVMVGADQG